MKFAHDKKPDYLWIGCSDSRVSKNEITITHSGEIFVHRKIAIICVLEYAGQFSINKKNPQISLIKTLYACDTGII